MRLKRGECTRRIRDARPAKPRSLKDYYSIALWSVLLLKGRSVDARNALERLGKDKLQNPDVAIYYACVLAANNNEQEALKYEQIGLTSKTLLPEEERLLKEFLGS